MTAGLPEGGGAALPTGPVVVPDENAEELYEHAPCGYLSTMPDGTIIRVNQTLLSWTGHRREELVGRRRFADLLTAGGRIYHETHYAPLLAMQGTAREIALDLVRSDGTRLPVLLNAVLVRRDDGAPHVIRVSVFNATDRRAYERELLRARERAERLEARARLLAQTLQASLIPPHPPAIPGLDLAAVYRPAGAGDEVGGDFYDVFETGEGEWGVVVGDVCGKGAAAAGVTALARHTVRASARRSGGPSAVLRVLNAALLEHPSDRFATVVYLRVRLHDPAAVEVTLACGGHPLPLWVGPAGVRPVGVPGSLLGVVEKPELHDWQVQLAPGESLFCYTDGFTEGRRDGELFGEERLAALLARQRGRPMDDVGRAVVEELVAYQGGMPRDDMAAVLLGVPARVRRSAAGGPAEEPSEHGGGTR